METLKGITIVGGYIALVVLLTIIA